MARALYGERGFFASRGQSGRTGQVGAAGPAGHFRTSAHASPAFAAALLRLIAKVDEALGHPDPLDVVDVGAGGGELLAELERGAGRRPAAPAGSAAALMGPDTGLARRLRLTAVEFAPRPPGLPARIGWLDSLPAAPFTGVLVATEWLDNVPFDVVEVDPAGVARYVEVDPETGEETLGDAVSGADADWLAQWWPLEDAPAGSRAEVGRTRDEAWAAAVAKVKQGLAVCVDYGHLAGKRPAFGTLTSFRAGRQVPPVPDGSCDITAHVAMDSLAANATSVLVSQRTALRALGVRGTRPPLSLASADPETYVRALAAASVAAELTDPAGLGGHYWLLQPVRVDAQLVTGWIGEPDYLSESPTCRRRLPQRASSPGSRPGPAPGNRGSAS